MRMPAIGTRMTVSTVGANHAIGTVTFAVIDGTAGLVGVVVAAKIQLMRGAGAAGPHGAIDGWEPELYMPSCGSP